MQIARFNDIDLHFQEMWFFPVQWYLAINITMYSYQNDNEPHLSLTFIALNRIYRSLFQDELYIVQGTMVNFLFRVLNSGKLL
jgi:hypothetical protein